MTDLIRKIGLIFIKITVVLLIVSIVFNLVNAWIIFTDFRTVIRPMLVNISSNNFLTPEIAQAYTGNEKGIYDINNSVDCVFNNVKNNSVKDIKIIGLSDVISRNDRNEGDTVSFKVDVTMNTFIWTLVGPINLDVVISLEYTDIVCLRRYKE